MPSIPPFMWPAMCSQAASRMRSVLGQSKGAVSA